MKKLFTLAALATFGTMATTAQAGAVTIDFDDTLPTYFNLPTYQEDGFTLTSNTPDSTLIDDNNTVRGNLGVFSGGTNSQSIFWGANGETSALSLANDSGLSFSVLSLDASSVYNSSGVLTLTGTLSSGGSVTENLVLNSALTTYNLSSMSDITDLTISFDGAVYDAPFDLDNVNVNVVPIPAAVWLFGSALAGLLGWSRRRTAAN